MLWIGFLVGGMVGFIISFIVEILCIVAGKSDIETWMEEDK